MRISLHGVDLVRSLSTYRYLDISNNKIKKLPTGLGTMDRLQKIKVLGNPLNRVPKEIVDVRIFFPLLFVFFVFFFLPY